MSPSMYGGAVRDGVTPAYPVLGPTVIQLRGEHDLSSVVSLSETIALAVGSCSEPACACIHTSIAGTVRYAV